jgi:hypothetical protein
MIINQLKKMHFGSAELIFLRRLSGLDILTKRPYQTPHADINTDIK